MKVQFNRCLCSHCVLSEQHKNVGSHTAVRQFPPKKNYLKLNSLHIFFCLFPVTFIMAKADKINS